jgi:hypothetical protein
MLEPDLTRIRSDLDVVERAMGLRMPFDRGVLACGILLTISAICAAVVSLLVEADWLQLAPFTAIMVLWPVGLCWQSRCTPNPSPEMRMQVALSVSVYGVVWVAACGYSLATFLGPAVGTARTAGLYALSIGLLFGFSLILVRTALGNRERHYCLGLAISVLLAGMLLPVLDRHYSYPLAHCFMAAGYLAGVAIQCVQLRKAVACHAAD